MSDSAAGVTIAVAMPCPTRAASSRTGSVASPPAREETPSSTIPIMNRRLRPNRSATRPKKSVNPAAQSAKEVTIHCSAEVAKPSSVPMCGRATLRMEKSTARVKFAVSRTAMAIFCAAVKRSAGTGVDAVLGGGEVSVWLMTSRLGRCERGSQILGLRGLRLPSTDRVRLRRYACGTIDGMALPQSTDTDGPVTELGEFLRSRRDRITPDEAGVNSYGRRRVPGLRREELAQLAGVSVTYLTRLEQGQSQNASDAIIDALARALQLDDDERAHLYALAHPAPPKRPQASKPEIAKPGAEQLLHSMGDVPAVLLGRFNDILAWNRAGHLLLAGHLDYDAPSMGGGSTEPVEAAVPGRAHPRSLR